MFAAILSLALILSMPMISAAWSALIGGLACTILFGASWLTFARSRILLDPVVPILSSAMVFLVGILGLYSQKRR